MAIPHAKCGAKTKRKGTPCSKAAGWRTDHPGEGRCYLHGGSTPIKTGRYSSIKRVELRERIERFEKDTDPLNLASEVALLRAFAEDLMERWDSIYGADGALLAWHESFKKGEDTPKPRQLPDFSNIVTVVDKIGAMVDRIQKHKSEGTISLATLNRVVEQLGEELVHAVQEIKLDADTSAKLFGAVERRWDSIRLEPDKTSGQGTAPGAREIPSAK